MLRRVSKEERKLEKEKKKEEKKEEKEKKKKAKRRSGGLSEGEEDVGKQAGANAPKEGPTGEGPPGAARGSAVYDIDPKDPAANKAATKIQATYRGHSVRRSLRSSMADKQHPQGDSPTKEQLEQEFSPDDTGSSSSSSSSASSASSDETIVSKKGSEIVPRNSWFHSVLGDFEKILVVGIGAALVSLFFFSLGDRNNS